MSELSFSIWHMLFAVMFGNCMGVVMMALLVMAREDSEDNQQEETPVIPNPTERAP